MKKNYKGKITNIYSWKSFASVYNPKLQNYYCCIKWNICKYVQWKINKIPEKLLLKTDNIFSFNISNIRRINIWIEYSKMSLTNI